MTSRPLALVTGASRGIGRAIAHRLAATHHVLVAARDTASLHTVVAEIHAAGGAAESVVLDVSDASSIAECMSRALAGRDLDVLVHNAGVPTR
jgi:3-oxoacyl-[acyl-carrier protein] reductase